MQLKDDTIEANSGEDMADYFLYHARSADLRYGLAVEQARVDRFHVSVLMREPGWDVDGVLRYWAFADRAMAEARYLELQRLFGELPDDMPMKDLLAALPKVEREASDEV